MAGRRPRRTGALLGVGLLFGAGIGGAIWMILDDMRLGFIVGFAISFAFSLAFLFANFDSSDDDDPFRNL